MFAYSLTQQYGVITALIILTDEDSMAQRLLATCQDHTGRSRDRTQSSLALRLTLRLLLAMGPGCARDRATLEVADLTMPLPVPGYPESVPSTSPVLAIEAI